MPYAGLQKATHAEITDAADVGHGTFYLPSTKWLCRSSTNTLPTGTAAQAAAADLDDPAEVVAHAARQIGRLIVTDPLYQWFLQRSGVPVEDMRKALGVFVARDIQRGINSGRFVLPEGDPAMNFLFGGIVTGFMTSFETDDPDRAVDDLTEMLLRGLGLPVDEARQIAHGPFEKLDPVDPPSKNEEQVS